MICIVSLARLCLPAPDDVDVDVKKNTKIKVKSCFLLPESLSCMMYNINPSNFHHEAAMNDNSFEIKRIIIAKLLINTQMKENVAFKNKSRIS